MDQISPVVMVVDDDPVVRDIVEEVLRKAGFQVLTATSGEAALQLFAAHIIDVVFTDISMGGISGFELMRRIHVIDDSVRVVIMTGHDSYDMVLRALQAGAYDYLDKPLRAYDAIVSSARRASENAQLQRENSMLMQRLQASHTKLEAANERLMTLNRKLKHLANTDGLTELYNRRYIDAVISKEADRRNRYHDPLTVILLDVDNFKQFNDEHGHDGGDKALIQVARLLQKCARSTDIVGRYGGEEFIAVLTKTGPENAMIFAERLRIWIDEATLDLDGPQAHLSISLGIAGVEADDPVIAGKELVLRADKALYHAKETGRNKSCQFDSRIDEADIGVPGCLSCVENDADSDDDSGHEDLPIAV